MTRTQQSKKQSDEEEIAQRRDAALRRALNTPSKQNKDYVKGEPQKKKAKPSASEKKKRA